MTPNWLYWPAAAAAAWAPSDLTNLVGWWQADAISGLSNNDPVSTWEDSSASGYDATASSGDRPTYITNAQNSLPVVRFNGSNHLNLGSTDLFRNVGGGTIYAVTKDAAITTVSSVFNCGVTASNLARLFIQSGAGGAGNNDKFRLGGRRLDTDSFRGVVSAQQVTTSWTLLGAVADWTGSVLTQYIDAVVDGQDTSFHSGGNTSNTATLANGTNIGASFSTNNLNAFDGDIAEIVVVHEALSTSDREKLEGYLAWKWGLEANLPNGHPYENAAP